MNARAFSAITSGSTLIRATPVSMAAVATASYLVAAGVEAGLWPLVAVLVVASVIGLFYYLRVVVVMVRPPGNEAVLPAARASLAGGVVLAVLAVMLVALGVYPGPLIRALQTVVL